ncbi:OmpA family protein [Sphingomonas lenta]|uniref:OmpA family protein n=1 Tax=Sphingomonas lenta TaxID=1141887 RepID=UPI001595E2D7|nr:OmpA family protein [Sphingomonas lenta]
MRPLLPALALAVAGCSEPSPDGQAQPPPAAAVSAPEADVGGVATTGGGLRGEVSALAADTGGLNTRVTDLGTVIELPADTLFEFDKAELTPAAQENLLKAAEAIRRAPPGPVAVTGHTDAKGSDAYNQELSEARARAVAEWMRGQVGVRQRSFTVAGKGEAQPVAPNARLDGSDDEGGRARNRRVELLIPNR